jgi:hypothetical protein
LGNQPALLLCGFSKLVSPTSCNIGRRRLAENLGRRWRRQNRNETRKKIEKEKKNKAKKHFFVLPTGP